VKSVSSVSNFFGIYVELMSHKILLVKVVPNSKTTEIVGYEGDVLKIRIAAPPDKGKANDELIAFLAKEYKISKSQITILQGHTSRLKRVSIEV